MRLVRARGARAAVLVLLWGEAACAAYGTGANGADKRNSRGDESRSCADAANFEILSYDTGLEIAAMGLTDELLLEHESRGVGLDALVCCPGNRSEWARQVDKPWEKYTCGFTCAICHDVNMCDPVEQDFDESHCAANCDTTDDCVDPELPMCNFGDRNDLWGICETKNYWWLVGVGLSLAGSIIGNFGIQIQKVAYEWNSKRPEAKRVSNNQPFRIPLWCLGMTCMILGALLDMASLGFAAQSLLAPIAACTLLINLIMVPAVVGEMPNKHDMVSAFVITGGCILAVWYADHSTAQYSLYAMLSGFLDPYFAIVWGCQMTVVAFMMHYVNKKVQSGFVEQCVTESHTKKGRKRMRWFTVCIAGLGGMHGGNSMLFAKTFIESLKVAAVDGLSGGETIAVVLCALICMLSALYFQVMYLNSAMKRFDMLMVVPVYQAFWIASSTVNGMLFYREYRAFSTMNTIMFPLGVIVTLAGCLFLSVEDKEPTRGSKETQEMAHSENTYNLYKTDGGASTEKERADAYALWAGEDSPMHEEFVEGAPAQGLGDSLADQVKTALAKGRARKEKTGTKDPT